ncbi:MAG: hypothetical protein U9Q78_02185 [Chloroflexota bacterium]|nr:hypothetical protein [Chloroflexota bacterium]
MKSCTIISAMTYRCAMHWAYRDLSEGHFPVCPTDRELCTLYNLRERVTKHMQETDENLIDKAFEHVTDKQIEAYQLKTDQQRMDSTLIASNTREMTRLQLLVKVLQRVHRMLDERDREHYAEEFEPFTKGSSGQYTYHLKGEDVPDWVLRCVSEEHFLAEKSALRPKEWNGRCEN